MYNMIYYDSMALCTHRRVMYLELSSVVLLTQHISVRGAVHVFLMLVLLFIRSKYVTVTNVHVNVS